MSETNEPLLQNIQGEYLPQHRDPSLNSGAGGWATNKGREGAQNVRIDDGHDETQGAKADAPATSADTTPWSIVALLKGILGKLLGTLDVQLKGRNVVQAIEEELPAGANQIGAVKQGTAAAETAPWPVKQTDRIAAAPVVGAKTISTSAAELFAGASRLANRISMTVYNESTTTVYFGPAGVTTATGFPLLPGDSVTFQFRPSTATAIYGIGAASSAVRVVEFA